ncbi:MAG: DUF2974 domain-containing protein [Ruminococcus sp.]|nr:DUF2974 domain-containing protein [Ruminococcus sp.]
MHNIFDYLKWRGDLSLEADGLNNLDILILARLSYLPLEGIVPEEYDKSISIEEASCEFFIREMQDGVFWKKDPHFLREIGRSERFKNLRLSASKSFMDRESKTQFYALTVDLGLGKRLISFRGTDNTLVGWQEVMSFCSLDTLPSQKKALEYFEKAANEYSGEFYLAGHSKGGNLAIYSAVSCKPEVRDRIISVYNFDGPGVNEEVFKSEAYIAVNDRINTFVPQSSVFGMILEHDEEFSIVKSAKRSFMQHDIYSWVVDGKDFIYLDKRTNSSYFINNTLNTLIDDMTPDEINEFIDAVFKVIESSDKTTVDGLQREWYKSYAKMLRSLVTLDKEERRLIFSTFAKAIKSAGKNIRKKDEV